MTLSFNELTIKHIKNSYYTLSFKTGEQEAVITFTNIDTLWRYIGSMLTGPKSPSGKDW